MNLVEQVAGLIAVACAVAGLALQVRATVQKQRQAEQAAYQQTQKQTRREGYDKRSDEVRPVIDRVIGLLDGIYASLSNPAEVRRRVTKAIDELDAAREGEPDAD